MSRNLLNVLGCMPERLNLLFELANDSIRSETFRVFKNLPDMEDDFYVPMDQFNVTFYDGNLKNVEFKECDLFSFGVVGTKSKPHVYSFYKNLIKMDDEKFINLIHPNSYISTTAELNNGIQIESLCSVSNLAKIGFGVTIKRNSSIGHHTNVNDFVTINPGSHIGGFVHIGKKTLIGMGSTIIHNINIGENCIIGAGSVVVKDIPPNSVAYGNPCKVHRMVD